MKLGDFTELAKNYRYRNSYSLIVLKALSNFVCRIPGDVIVADIGAGTGKLTENLIELGLTGVAIEPNAAMRAEGINLLNGKGFKWLVGSAEATGLPDSSVDWILMGSSFHWTDQQVALREFYRVLKPSGYFTAIWNPRDIEHSEIEQKVEQIIHRLAPNIKRVSSGAMKYTSHLEALLISSGLFSDVIYIEAPHEALMKKEDYIGAWRSVNDIQSQAGTEIFEAIIKEISMILSEQDYVRAPYRSRSWTVRSTKPV
ncbi:class I SAM-dependent methyltransferase [Paenibacillus polymyxa]|uniref:class I SAM-dependent methyltransferase n=1 Tax=Paenibacillus polymyxa TaxID=1406 RepID=UPI0019F779EB|nr:class I SAM-dependent methyltransferase [Paenibacillus sp. EKM208P]